MKLLTGQLLYLYTRSSLFSPFFSVGRFLNVVAQGLDLVFFAEFSTRETEINTKIHWQAMNEKRGRQQGVFVSVAVKFLQRMYRQSIIKYCA